MRMETMSDIESKAMMERKCYHDLLDRILECKNGNFSLYIEDGQITFEFVKRKKPD
ncbi:MAG: hypothetical protein Q4B86_07350 [Eubacteriales bacterium]|nr:hypothetical protein [Eubacteriales bacterium]